MRGFVSPARVHCGSGASAKSGDELRAAGAVPEDGPALVVADEAILALGLAEPAIGGLRQAGFDVDVRPGVAAEPTAEIVQALMPAGSGGASGVVAVGGGSALDAAKLVTLSLATTIDLTAPLAADLAVRKGPPMVAVPTTAGTGAEATAVSMLWEGQRKRMFVNGALVPDAALLDPDLLAGLPAAVTAAAGLDAISHAVESLLSTYRTSLTETAARSALSLLPASVREAYENGGPAAREKTLLGAFQAGLALNASVVLGHSLAYAIAAEAGLSHGVSCAMALPYCIAHVRPAAGADVAEIARLICDEEAADGEELIGWLQENSVAMGIPTSLREVGIDERRLDQIARDCVERYPRPNSMRPIDFDAVRMLLDDFWVGDAPASWARQEPVT